MAKIKVSLPLIVEGRYDKSTLSGFIDGTIITTGGFSIFNDKEKQALLRRIAKGGVIVLTDSDGGGKQIRKFLASILPPDKIHNLFIPKIEGKESRKKKASKSGTLGGEGMEKDVLLRLLTPFASGEAMQKDSKAITNTFFDAPAPNDFVSRLGLSVFNPEKDIRLANTERHLRRVRKLVF